MVVWCAPSVLVLFALGSEEAPFSFLLPFSSLATLVHPTVVIAAAASLSCSGSMSLSALSSNDLLLERAVSSKSLSPSSLMQLDVDDLLGVFSPTSFVFLVSSRPWR